MSSNKFSRAIRRHHRQRLQTRTIKRLLNGWMFNYHYDNIVHYANRRRDNMKNCSCFMCGNPRRIFKHVTLAELRAKDQWKEQMVDYFTQKR